MCTQHHLDKRETDCLGLGHYTIEEMMISDKEGYSMMSESQGLSITNLWLGKMLKHVRTYIRTYIYTSESGRGFYLQH